MAAGRTAEGAARLLGRAARRRADGSRGPRARRAWRRLVQACGAGDLVAQDAVRAGAGLPEADVLDLLAAAPVEPADRAAYLALIGQRGQRRALDPDGSLLALAYRAARPEVRERLRGLMAAEGDVDVIRVVVTGDRRDRLAELPRDELDHLTRHFAEGRRWEELRGLARDLPLAQAAAVARLLPAHERPEGSAPVLAALAAYSAERLAATVERLPRDHLITHEIRSTARARASFSPDFSELAVCHVGRVPGRRAAAPRIHVDTLRLGTGEATHRFSGKRHYRYGDEESVLHLGEEILIRQGYSATEHALITRVVPDVHAIGAPDRFSALRRAGHGAVVIVRGRPAFIDPGARDMRRGPDLAVGSGPEREDHSAVATLPAAQLIAVAGDNGLRVLNERGEVVHELATVIPEGALPLSRDAYGGLRSALTFLSPRSLARHLFWRDGTDVRQRTEIWELPAGGAPRRVAEHHGPIRERWPLETWRGPALDDRFARRLLTSDLQYDVLAPDIPGLQRPFSPVAGSPESGRAVAMAPWGDMVAVQRHGEPVVEVHSAHLPVARALLERPMVRGGPGDVRRVDELRRAVADPAVRQPLDLLATCLAERFGADIALAPPSAFPSDPTGIALGHDHDHGRNGVG
ncbi:hypothetical protein [Streptomyces sp. SBT349]|uniref:hypothetical protein n=1 Tax=Streptomyces sp. SBT349 TaxID=1580539 RepID=UPI00066AEBCB|nr:hypothetical protein [Streptomyces sp. SBT349]